MKYFLIPFAIVIGLAGFSSADNAKGETIMVNQIQLPPAPLEELYTAESNPEEYCLALNIYFESRTDNIAGRAAVADVVLNRVHNDRWPNTICDVVYDGPVYESWKTRQQKDLPDEERVYYPKRHRCQFSWYCDGMSDIPRNETVWRESQELAYQMYRFDRYVGISEGATHYHATYVDPAWNKHFKLIGRIGLHIFYRQD